MMYHLLTVMREGQSYVVRWEDGPDKNRVVRDLETPADVAAVVVARLEGEEMGDVEAR